MGNRKLIFVGMADLNRRSSLEGIGFSIDLANPEIAVSVKELAEKMDVAEMSTEEIITAPEKPENEDQQISHVPKDPPPGFMAFDPSRNPAICLREKFAEHLNGCSYATPCVIKAAAEKDRPAEKITPLDFDSFLEFAEGAIFTNRDRQIPRNLSRRQFQKCRR
jgi:hypothetical protein